MNLNYTWLGLCCLLAGLGLAQATPVVPAVEPSRVTPLQWSVRLAESEMARRSATSGWKPEGKAKWDYTMGLFTLALLQLNEAVPLPGSVDFAKQAVGSFVAAEGTIHGYQKEEYQLDALNPGKTVLRLWQLTREERYLQAARTLRQQLETQPRTPDGGFWHKQRYTNQMWLDGLYMAAPFYSSCAQIWAEPVSSFDDVARQIRLADEHTYDARTGLFFHGWDASHAQPWADPRTGCSSNFWGRAVGWYAMALVDTLDTFPTNHPARPHILATFQKLAAGVIRWQDAASGVWWQVLDQGPRPGNYREATGSAMLVYALAKGVNRGYLPPALRPAIEKGYAGILKNFIQADGPGRWSLTHCCAVAGLGGSPSNGKMRDGSFAYYISEPVVTNDLKGVGPFILAGIEMKK